MTFDVNEPPGCVDDEVYLSERSIRIRVRKIANDSIDEYDVGVGQAGPIIAGDDGAGSDDGDGYDFLRVCGRPTLPGAVERPAASAGTVPARRSAHRGHWHRLAPRRAGRESRRCG